MPVSDYSEKKDIISTEHNNYERTDLNSKELIAAAIIFVLIGAMVMNPPAGLLCFTLSGILTFFAAIKGTKRMRYIAFLLLIIIAVFITSVFPEARHHLLVYRAGH